MFNRTNVMVDIINKQADTISRITIENKTLRDIYNRRNEEIRELRKEGEELRTKLNQPRKEPTERELLLSFNELKLVFKLLTEELNGVETIDKETHNLYYKVCSVLGK